MKCRKKICEEQIKLQKCDINIWNPFIKIMCVTILFITPVSVGQSLEQTFCLSGSRQIQEVIHKSPNFSEHPF